MELNSQTRFIAHLDWKAQVEKEYHDLAKRSGIEIWYVVVGGDGDPDWVVLRDGSRVKGGAFRKMCEVRE